MRQDISRYTKKIFLIPPFYFFVCIFITIILYFFDYKIKLFPTPFYIFTSIPIMCIGIYFIVASYFLFQKKDTTVLYNKSTSVVADGLYKISRNPMYLGFLLVLIGFSLLSENLISFISPILFFLVIHWMFIPYEEEKMEEEMGEVYLEYKKKVRPWL
ncbi:methyltransferase family protein [Sulfurospirillum arcachonense]|uniref:methyltransferase family protein n=1 Tax=Sulfurospirillum arcachonense TaxID=57666 RepID=UPI00046B08E6|nr:methyltransferase [Sulfurospirillum arcachonense]